MRMLKPFYILALDGGGTAGIYSAQILACLEKSLNTDNGDTDEKIRIKDCFDLIAGTSTGSIIAGAAAIGMPMKKVVKLFKKDAPEIFKRRFLSFGFTRSKYSNNCLEDALGKLESVTMTSEGCENKFTAETTLGEIKTPLMIMGSDMSMGKVWVFKSGYAGLKNRDHRRDRNLRLKDAILSSCAAPTFLDPHEVHDALRNVEEKSLLADGGLWANNPSVFSYIEASTSIFDKRKRQIRILSIGTGPEIAQIYKKKCCWGFLTGWGHKKFIKYILHLQSQASTNMARLLLGNDQYLRIQPDEGDWELDETAKTHLKDLRKQGKKDFKSNEAEIMAGFIPPNRSLW